MQEIIFNFLHFSLASIRFKRYLTFTEADQTERDKTMTNYSETKVGDEIEIPGTGKVKLSRPIYAANRPNHFIASGYRWIESKQKFSGTGREYIFSENKN